MFQKFKKSSVAPKIKLGVSYLSRVIISICLFTILVLSGLMFGFSTYRSIAINTNSIGRIQANLLEVRIAALKFIRTGDEKNQLEFERRIEKTKSIIDPILNNSTRPDAELLEKVTQISSLTNEYLISFRKMAVLKTQENELILNTLDKKGLLVEASLNEIILSSRNKGDNLIFSHASLALRSLLTAKYYQVKYLDKSSRVYASKFSCQSKKSLL
jgi:methyl-accepting chemotaxis protein